MASENGSNSNITLSAIDFLKLSEQKRVARVDLADAGAVGVVYVCDLTAAEQQKLFSQATMRVYNDKSRDIPLPKDAVSKLLRAGMVTDGQDGALFEPQFEDSELGYITVPVKSVVYYNDIWLKELGSSRIVNDMIQRMPNAVTNLVTKEINLISGLGDDDDDILEQKKSGS